MESCFGQKKSGFPLQPEEKNRKNRVFWSTYRESSYHTFDDNVVPHIPQFFSCMRACTHAQSQIISTQLHFQVRGSVQWLLPAQKSLNWLATETWKYPSRDIRTLKTWSRRLQFFSVTPNGNHLAAPSVTHVQHRVIWRNMKEFTPPGGWPFSYSKCGYKCKRLHILRKHKKDPHCW